MAFAGVVVVVVVVSSRQGSSMAITTGLVAFPPSRLSYASRTAGRRGKDVGAVRVLTGALDARLPFVIGLSRRQAFGEPMA